MLERPAVQDSQIITCLQTAFGLPVTDLEFLPLGADRHTAVFRANAGQAYFVKLRSGDFDEMSICVPKLLHDQGQRWIIAPLPTLDGQLWAELDHFRVMVFPFVAGQNGYEMRLTDQHWVDFGRALKALHTAPLPAEISAHIQRETYGDHWRKRVREFQQMAATMPFADPVAAALAGFIQAQQATLDHLLQQAETYAVALSAQPLSPVLCHADIHAGNLLITADHLYLVDWDTLLLAPKERDLMFIGGGLFDNQRSPDEEVWLFYQGYGDTNIDPVALVYYRYERIVQDIAAYCEEILLTTGDSPDRANGLRQLQSQFGANGVIAVAFRTEQMYHPQG